MKRYRRLLALVALSLLLHVLVIGIAARRAMPHAGVILDAPPAPLALRLQKAQEAVPRAERVAAAPVPAPARAPIPGTRPTAPPPAPAPVEARPALPAVLARDAVPMLQEPGANALVQMPGRYRVSIPPSATLTYELARPGEAPAPATLHWTTDGNTYTVEARGVTGNLSAAGRVGDAGVSPDTASDNGAVATTFDVDNIVIDGRTYPNNVGSQDRASLLLQLIGMGLAEPDQMRGVIEIYVAAAREPEIQKFQVLDDEDVATPLGTFPTRHLVQLVRMGEPRLEIWLAPRRGWLPVLLRVTGADGTVSTQVLTRAGDK